jgi:hypothetical protein
MAIRAFHPILYVADPYAERDFFARFGFATVYEGDEFPDFLAVQCGPVIFGLSGNKDNLPSVAHEGVRWQFRVNDVDEVIAVCDAAGLPYEAVVETGGDTHRARIAKVTSPNGVLVWFEGPNEVGEYPNLPRFHPAIHLGRRLASCSRARLRSLSSCARRGHG